MAKRILTTLVALSVLVALLPGCSTTKGLHSTRDRKMTAGVVRKEIRKGMAGADVAVALGAPNIVSFDDDGQETWIYDKIATEASYANTQADVGASVGAGGVAGNTLILGMGKGKYGKTKGAAATTQRTLTVVIKFTAESKVKSFSYHQSEF